MVAFTVSSASDGHTLHSDHIGSDDQRWCFHWDAQGCLWAYSSDTGYITAIAIQPDSTVITYKASKNTPMPKPVYEFLPSRLKLSWAITDLFE
jgi:hypothetical protein